MNTNESKYKDNESSIFIRSLYEGQMTQQEFCKKIGITYHTLHRAFKTNNLTSSVLGKMVRSLKLSEEQMIKLSELVK